MRFVILASGSKANATLVCTGGRAILIDCGLSYRELTKRMAAVHFDIADLSAIFLTHEHSDHVSGLHVLQRQTKVPVFTVRETAEAAGLEPLSVEQIRPGESFWLGATKIRPFSVSHDAVSPVAFRVESEGFIFTQLTDTGRTTPEMIEALTDAHAIVLESNYDPDLLQSCAYPPVLKMRIASVQGHLSNAAAGGVLAQVLHSTLEHVVLAHLSENSNSPRHALNSVCSAVSADVHPVISVAGPSGMGGFAEVTGSNRRLRGGRSLNSNHDSGSNEKRSPVRPELLSSSL